MEWVILYYLICDDPSIFEIYDADKIWKIVVIVIILLV